MANCSYRPKFGLWLSLLLVLLLLLEYWACKEIFENKNTSCAHNIFNSNLRLYISCLDSLILYLFSFGLNILLPNDIDRSILQSRTCVCVCLEITGALPYSLVRHHCRAQDGSGPICENGLGGTQLSGRLAWQPTMSTTILLLFPLTCSI